MIGVQTDEVTDTETDASDSHLLDVLILLFGDIELPEYASDNPLDQTVSTQEMPIASPN
jgi:hypothetical protein